MYKATSNSKVEVSTREQTENLKVSASSSTSDISSLNPNDGDKGLKRTLKSRHLAVNILFYVYVIRLV